MSALPFSASQKKPSHTPMVLRFGVSYATILNRFLDRNYSFWYAQGIRKAAGLNLTIMANQAITKEQTRHHILGFDTEVAPILGIGLSLTALVLASRPRLVPIPLALTALAAMPYRNPQRTTPDTPNYIFAIADGTILQIDELYEHRFLHTDAIRITTLTSPLDIPVNRSPTTGTVHYLEHVAGEYLPLWNNDAFYCNTRTYIGIATTWGPLLITQIAGGLSRCVIHRIRPGDTIQAGERVGTVRFGSRFDLIAQRDALKPTVQIGQKVKAGMTPIAHVVPL